MYLIPSGASRERPADPPRLVRQILHQRTRDGHEVDCALEARDGRVVGIEVKSAATVVEPDFRGLCHLAAAAPDRFVAAAVSCGTDRSLMDEAPGPGAESPLR
jgi:hypothetical protein